MIPLQMLLTKPNKNNIEGDTNDKYNISIGDSNENIQVLRSSSRARTCWQSKRNKFTRYSLINPTQSVGKDLSAKKGRGFNQFREIKNN